MSYHHLGIEAEAPPISYASIYRILLNRVSVLGYASVNDAIDALEQDARLDVEADGFVTVYPKLDN